MKKLILSLIAVLFIISACSDSSSPSNEKSNEILPLKVGNEWWLKNTPYIGDDSLERFNIIREAKYYDENWFLFNLFEKQTLMKNKSDGLWVIEFNEENPDGKKTLYYKFPASVGTITNIKNAKITLLSINEKVDVPLGSFNCYLYRTEYESGYMNDIYLSPGTGFVKMIYYKDSSGVKVVKTTCNLINYIVK